MSSSISPLAAALVALAFAGGCGPKTANTPDSVTTATQRLQGVWKVASFAPESALEAPLQGLLNAQLGALTVTFDGDRFSAAGPGTNMSGSFKVWSASLNQLSGTIYDPTGVGYRISGQFEGPSFLFRSYDSPWKGEGKLVR